MMKWASLVLALAVAMPLTARAGSAAILNSTGHCAWVTVYYASGMTRWEIPDGPNGRPRHIKPGADEQFLFLDRPEIKVRAEITRNADCSGGTIADVYDVRKGIDPRARSYATIKEVGGRFWIVLKS